MRLAYLLLAYASLTGAVPCGISQAFRRLIGANAMQSTPNHRCERCGDAVAFINQKHCQPCIAEIRALLDRPALLAFIRSIPNAF